MIGIVGYGIYLPKKRIVLEKTLQERLKIFQKTVPAHDEDAATMAVAAAKKALESSSLSPSKIGAVYVGSESHPYAVKPTSTIVGSAIDIGSFYMAADLSFACKSGTAAIQICSGLVSSNMIEYGLAIGSDVATGAPGDVLESSASAGSAAFILGNNKNEIIAEIEATLSVSTDTPDFWRRPQQKYPTHTNRFTGEPSYFSVTEKATNAILKKTGLLPKDFSYVVFHQPNGKFPRAVAKKLGFSFEQLKPGLVVEDLGNSYSANSLIGLAAILDIAKPNEKILLVSYGSGSGSDAFVLRCTGQRIRDAAHP